MRTFPRLFVALVALIVRVVRAFAKDTPKGRAVTPRPSPTAKVVALPGMGGLHHRYQWRDAAWSHA